MASLWLKVVTFLWLAVIFIPLTLVSISVRGRLIRASKVATFRVLIVVVRWLVSVEQFRKGRLAIGLHLRRKWGREQLEDNGPSKQVVSVALSIKFVGRSFTVNSICSSGPSLRACPPIALLANKVNSWLKLVV